MAIQKIPNTLIADNAVTASKIANGTLTADDIAANSITAAKISASTSPTFGGIDVTGTATMDGLTVNSSEVLFDNTGGDFTLKLNTNAVSDKNEIIMGDTGTPLAKFGVGGTANDIITGSDGQDFNIGTAGGGRAINFSTDNFASVEMKLDGGNVGIGGTPTNYSDHKTLSLYGNTGTGAGFIEFNDTSGNADAVIFSDDGNLFINADYDNTAASSSIRFRVDGSSEKMRIDSSGAVGIGQVPETARFSGHDILQVGGRATFLGNDTVTSTGQTALLDNLYYDASGNFQHRGDARGVAMQFVEGNVIFSNSNQTTGTPTVSERMKIKSDGQITTQGDILPGADVIMANGRGISFAASSNAGGMTSELLDDYEEGTFTPTFSGATLSQAVGSYTKIGNQVTVHFRVITTGGLPSSGGQVQVGNLPFTIASGFGGVGGLYVGPSNVSSATGGGGTIVSFAPGGEAFLRYVNVDTGTLGYTLMGELEVSANNVVTAIGTHTYQV